MSEINSKKRLMIRAHNRGIKEMDIILGNFVTSNLENFSILDMEELEAMMLVDDQSLYAMITGHQEFDERYKHWLTQIQMSLKISPNLN